MNLREMLFRPGGWRLRCGWCILLYVLLTACAAQVAVWVYYAAGSISLPRIISGGERANLVLLDLLLCLAALTSAFTLIRYVNLRPFAALGFSFHDRIWIEFGQGALLGAAMVAAIAWAEQLLGVARLARAGWDMKSVIYDAAAYIITFSLAAALEELLARGYIFQCLIEGIGRVAAVAATSILFGLGHVMNPHATVISLLNTVLAGVWLAAGYLKTRSLWLPTTMHMAWNFFLGYVFGFPVSGLRLSQSMLEAQSTGPEWVTGGAYGPEGGVLCTAVILLGSTCLVFSNRIHASARATALWLPQEDSRTGVPPDGTPAGT